MVFRKKFLFGLLFIFIGILMAFDRMTDYRTASILIFWSGIIMSLCGLLMMYKGIELKSNND